MLFVEKGIQSNNPIGYTFIPIRPTKKKFLFPVLARITFGERIKKNFIFYFIEFVTTINYVSVKTEPFCPLFQSKYFSIQFTIWFHDRNTFLMIWGKCKIIPVSEILGWPCRKNKNKNRTRASLFQLSEDGKQEISFMWP